MVVIRTDLKFSKLENLLFFIDWLFSLSPVFPPTRLEGKDIKYAGYFLLISEASDLLSTVLK